MKRSKGWKVSNCADKTVYNAKLARKLRKLALKVSRIVERNNLSYVDISVIEGYIAARAKVVDGTTSCLVVDDYMFAIKED